MPARAVWAVAAGSAALGAVAGLPLGEAQEIAASAVLAGAMGALAFEDMRSMRLPDAWTLAAAVAGLAAVAEAGSAGAPLAPALGWAILSAILCGGALFLLREAFFRLRGFEGLGFGDVKLAAAGGVWLGWELFPVAVLLAAIAAILWVAAVAAIERNWSGQRKIPFGAFLAPAIWVAWIGARLAAAV